MPPKKNEDQKKGGKKAPKNNRTANGDPGVGSSANPPPNPPASPGPPGLVPPASGVVPGHVSRVDGKFVCGVPLANGKSCGTRMDNKDYCIRNHKSKSSKHPDFKPETRQKPFEQSQAGKLSRPRAIRCMDCDHIAPNAHALIAHYRTVHGVRTEADIFGRYPPHLQAGKF